MLAARRVAMDEARQRIMIMSNRAPEGQTLTETSNSSGLSVCQAGWPLAGNLHSYFYSPLLGLVEGLLGAVGRPPWSPQRR